METPCFSNAVIYDASNSNTKHHALCSIADCAWQRTEVDGIDQSAASGLDIPCEGKKVKQRCLFNPIIDTL